MEWTLPIELKCLNEPIWAYKPLSEIRVREHFVSFFGTALKSPFSKDPLLDNFVSNCLEIQSATSNYTVGINQGGFGLYPQAAHFASAPRVQ